MSIRRNIFLALTSGLLLAQPWSVSAFYFMVFIAWVPLLLLEEQLRDHTNPYAIFNYAFVSFLLWNIIATWWIVKPQVVGPAGDPSVDSFGAHLDGVRVFSSELGSGLAVAQSGQRTGQHTKTHPVVRVYRCSRWIALDHNG